MAKCLFCNQIVKKNTGFKEYCNINCYQKYRYKTNPKIRQKQKELGKIRRKERYHTDEAFRLKTISYSRDWQKRNKPRQVKIVQRYQNKKKMEQCPK